MDKKRFLGALKTLKRPKQLTNTPEEDTKKGFTIIEVMIFLAISGLLLVGVLGGTYASIAAQRYNDSVRDFAEFLRQLYGEVISPETLGAAGDDDYGGGNSDDYAIYGKVAVFGLNDQTTVYTATLVGDVNIPSGSQTFMKELQAVNAKIFCGIEVNGVVQNETTVDTYTPLWQSQINGAKPEGSESAKLLSGTLIIARSPTSGTVHTVYNPVFSPDLANECQPDNLNASNQLANEIRNNLESFNIEDDINFCIKSDQSNFIRDVVLTADGHNNTAVNILDDNDGVDICGRY